MLSAQDRPTRRSLCNGEPRLSAWLSDGEWQWFAIELGAYDLQTVVNETNAILEAGDNNAFNACKGRSAPLGSVDAAVIACRRQAANVTFAAVVIRRHSRVIEEGEQLVT